MLPKTSKQKLGFEIEDHSLKKHPSVKSLFDENGNQKVPSENISTDLLTFKVNTNRNGSNNHVPEKICGDDNIKEVKKETTNIAIKINTCENKFVDVKETFYQEVPNNKMLKINKNCENNNNSNICLNKINVIFSDKRKDDEKVNMEKIGIVINNLLTERENYGIINDEKNQTNKNNNKNVNNIKKNKKLLGFGLNNNKLGKPDFYNFSEKQILLDKEITNDMKEGKDYATIEKKFIYSLKKSKV